MLDDEHVVVEGVNMVKKHTKPNPMKNQPGGIVDKEMPIHVSNVAICATRRPEGRPRRHSKCSRTARKVRVFKSNGEVVDAEPETRGETEHGPP